MYYKDKNNELFYEPTDSVISSYELTSITEDDYYYILQQNESSNIPQSITPTQARIILHRNGLLDAAEEAIKLDKEFEIYWEYSLSIERNNQTLLSMANHLGLSEEMLDNMFIEASGL